LRGPTSKERGREGKGREEREGEGEGHEPPHYLEEVYAYADCQQPCVPSRPHCCLKHQWVQGREGAGG